MSYSSIDDVIIAWARSHSLYLYTNSQGEEVRSVDLIGSRGRKCQIWITTSGNGKFKVTVWDYSHRKREFCATPENLHQFLDRAYLTASEWVTTEVKDGCT
jgi:hypothetical protein